MEHNTAYVADYITGLLHEGGIKSIAAAFGAGVSAIMSGPAAVLVNMLLLLMLLDYLLGFCRAWQKRRINRAKMVRGAVKMLCTPIAVLVIAALDFAMRMVTVEWLPEGFTLAVPLRDLFLLYLCAHESLSCLEHLAALGVPVPASIRERLANYRENIIPSTKTITK